MPARRKLSTAINRSRPARTRHRGSPDCAGCATNSSAPTTSTSDSATWATTRARRRPNRSRRVGRAAAAGFHGGARGGRGRADRRQQAEDQARRRRPAAAMNAKMRQSTGERRRTRDRSRVVRNATSNRLSHWASTAPARGADRGDQQALGEQLTDDPAARRADAPDARRSRVRARSRAPASDSRGSRRR